MNFQKAHNSVLSRCVLILLLFCGVLIGKVTGGLYAKVEGIFFEMLESQGV
jgi:hypothetical protein